MTRKDYQKRKDETIGQWCERIAVMCHGKPVSDILTLVREVSVTSYAEGANAERVINEKLKGLFR